jgi:hypothetical protein
MAESTSTSAKPHVLIVGAGLTGLILAHGLDKHGIKYDIFDDSQAAGSYQFREWTMGIHWSYETLVRLLPEQISSRLVSDAAVDKSLDYSSAPANGFAIYDGKTGSVLQEIASEGSLLRVSRRKLRKLLNEGINVKVGGSLLSDWCDRTLNGNAVRSQTSTTRVLRGWRICRRSLCKRCTIYWHRGMRSRWVAVSRAKRALWI